MFSEEDSQLIRDLDALSQKSPKLVKSSSYVAPAGPNIIVRSWKMNEFKYYTIPSPFPTLARGLFTVQLPSDANESQGEMNEPRHRIIARGYDKFFNIGEVPWTIWTALETHTTAPYTLSLKSNGCIVFIAALNPTKLIVTSKHSVGPVAGSPLSHAEAGEIWLRKYLKQKGKTEEDLAAKLWENNWTAISELCDDSFEEHVLGYTPDQTGLHLHGINVSTKQFQTLSHEEVDAFAEEWGFIKTASLILNSIEEVKAFTDGVANTGKWNGEAVEGFVVRTHITESPNVEANKVTGEPSPHEPPYAPGSPFFFKIKFDEPYMMYRDWREVTKSLLSSKGPLSADYLPKSKMKRPETRLYVRWVIEEIKKDSKPFAEFNKGKGIIATREKFLKWLETNEGKAELEETKTKSTVRSNSEEFRKTIIVPVAIPGCGKTAISVALTHIFGFGHTQSDDVQAKKPAPVFIKNVMTLLKDHDVVIADKNNHLRQHRQALRNGATEISPSVRLLALHWSLDKPPSTIHRICSDRVLHRGKNHQTLRADLKAKSHEDVIWMFIEATEELTASEVDEIVSMDLEEGLEQTLDRAIESCIRVLGLERPSREKIQEALALVGNYTPNAGGRDDSGKKAFAPRYFGLLAEIDLQDVLDQCIPSSDERINEFWTHLKSEARIPKRPHVTIIHSNTMSAEMDLWNRCMELHQMTKPPLFKARLGNLVWNDRIMAVTVDDLQIDEAGTEELSQLGHDFASTLPHEVKQRLHITVGTKDVSIQPVEAKQLVESWRKGDLSENVQFIPLDGVINGRIKGLSR